MELCPSVGFEPSMPELLLDAVNTSLQNRLLQQKLTSVLHWNPDIAEFLAGVFIYWEFDGGQLYRGLSVFIAFDNFFKETLFYAYLLLWNTNAISLISIENSIRFPKHNQIHFFNISYVLQ